MVWGGLTSAARRPVPQATSRIRAAWCGPGRAWVRQSTARRGARYCRAATSWGQNAEPATTPCSSVQGPFLWGRVSQAKLYVCAGGPGSGGTTVRGDAGVRCFSLPTGLFCGPWHHCLLHCDHSRHLFQAAPLPGLLYLGEEVLAPGL